MKANVLKKSSKIQWSIRISLLITLFSVFLTNDLLAKTAKEIDANVDKDIILFFMTDEALNNFRTSKGWEVGLL